MLAKKAQSMPRLEAILESSLYVRDLPRAIRFYRDVLGLRLLSEFEEKRGAAFRIGESVLLIFDAQETAKPYALPAHGSAGPGHVAFRVAPEELPRWREHLQSHGVAIEKEFSFDGQPPSIYFRDPDGNVLELAVPAIWPG
jgi:catechol 2,3-dioxygenase-like lactoylglutathione lyase family enzyme